MKKTLKKYSLALGLSLAAVTSLPANATSNQAPVQTIEINQKAGKVQRANRVLVVMTNHSKYPSREDSTGLWLTELTHFYEVFARAGIAMDFVSPQGGAVPLDERSLGWLYSDNNAKALMARSDFANRLGNTMAASAINPADYNVIFYTGGHGTMWDFRDQPELKRAAEAIYQKGGIVSSVCHGASGLLSLENPDGTPLISQRRVTGFSNLEEKLSGVENQVPFALQTEMLKKGAKYEKGFLPFGSHVVTDGRLVTGQNPGSSREVAEAVLRAIRSLK